MSNARCAIYTRKSSEEGLGQDFNSLDAQREACAAFITSQRHEGWEALAEVYEDGGFSGGTINRPGIQKLLEDCRTGKIDTIVVYKIDRLTRALSDFAKMVELFDAHKVTFVSVTQQFNTTTSMGRLTLNVLLSFAQFEREVTGERIRDKIAASKTKGMWMGGHVPLGYEKDGRSLKINPEEQGLIIHIYQRYLALKNVQALRDELDEQGFRTKSGRKFFTGHLGYLLTNPIYRGFIRHKGVLHPGNHPPIVDEQLWHEVQTLREESKHRHRHCTRAKERSLLKGLLFDAEGRHMSPSHSNNKSKHYRYYVSQANIQGLPSKPDTLTKIPAGELEELLHQTIPALLQDDTRLIELFPNLTPQHRQQAAQVAQTWKNLTLVERHVNIRTLITRVELQAEHVQCHLSLAALSKILGFAIDTTDTAVFNIPIRLKRVQGGAIYIISHASGAREPNPTLIKAIAKATQWNQMLITGLADSQEAIAQQEGIRSGYLRKLMPLALLAPDIVEAIMYGEEPVGLTLAKLHTNKSADWQAQRSHLGFTAAR